MDNISFRLDARVDRNAVEPPNPQPQMTVAVVDASPYERWLEDRSAATGHTIFVVLALFRFQGVTHVIWRARPN